MINSIAPPPTLRTEPARALVRTVTEAAPTQSIAPPLADKAGSLTPPSLAADLVSAMGPPLDLKRIEAIRSAIAEGRYAIDPTAIAARMVDADLPAPSAEPIPS